MPVKTSTTHHIQLFVAMTMNQFGTKIKRLRSNSRGEYYNKTMKAWFQRQGIIYKVTTLYYYESNGKAERFNRTIITDVRTIIQKKSHLKL